MEIRLYNSSNFQSTTMSIDMFCKICKHKCKREIVFVTKIKTKQFQVRTCIPKTVKTCKLSNKLSYYFGKIGENIDLSHTYLAVQQPQKGSQPLELISL